MTTANSATIVVDVIEEVVETIVKTNDEEIVELVAGTMSSKVILY